MRKGKVDLSALDAAIKHWVYRLADEGINGWKAPDRSPHKSAHDNALGLIATDDRFFSPKHAMTDVSSMSAFRMGWFLGLGCAHAVMSDPLGNPLPDMLSEFTLTREMLWDEVEKAEAQRAKLQASGKGDKSKRKGKAA